MSEKILDLEDVGREDVAIAGGKGANLGEMVQNGFPAPLFLTAGAAAIEVGSYLSHAGTVAREFGMPCVVYLAGLHTAHPIRPSGPGGR